MDQKIKFFIFLVQKKTKLVIKNHLYGKEFKFIKNKDLTQIINAQRNAFIKILRKRKYPTDILL